MRGDARGKISGVVFDIERYAIHDGPGIRTTVFVKGCPLRCLWCDNPESQLLQPEIVWFKDKCRDLLQCVRVCPTNAISIDEKNNRVINKSVCNLCGECLRACYSKSLSQIGKCMTVEEVLSEIKKDSIFYSTSGGGVTISGGEPLVQWKFVREVFRGCHEEGIHTALSTCGYASWRVMQKVLEFVDLVLYDIKIIQSEKHIEYTGVANSTILENAKRIGKKGIPMRIRIPIIPGYNDSDQNIRRIAEFIISLKNVEEVDLLPYHRFGVPKYEKLGKEYKLDDCKPPTGEDLRRIIEIMNSYKVKVLLYG